MQGYQHILLAVDFEQIRPTAERAMMLANTYQATLSLIHVVESIPFVDTSGIGMDTSLQIDLNNEMFVAAKNQMASLSEKLGIAENRCYLESGSPKLEINRVAEENQIDLIVVGSHGRHGLALLLGSTSNAVLHHAKCDVLAVRLKDE